MVLALSGIPQKSHALPDDSEDLLFKPEVFLEELGIKASHCAGENTHTLPISSILNIRKSMACDEQKTTTTFCKCLEQNPLKDAMKKPDKSLGVRMYKTMKKAILNEWIDDFEDWHKIKEWARIHNHLEGGPVCNLAKMKDMSEMGDEKCSDEEISRFEEKLEIAVRARIRTKADRGFHGIDEYMQDFGRISNDEKVMQVASAGGEEDMKYSPEQGINRLQQVSEDELAWVMNRIHYLTEVQKRPIPLDSLSAEDIFGEDSEKHSAAKKAIKNHLLISWILDGGAGNTLTKQQKESNSFVQLYHKIQEIKNQESPDSPSDGSFNITQRDISNLFNKKGGQYLENDCKKLQKSFALMCRKFSDKTKKALQGDLSAEFLTEGRNLLLKASYNEAERMSIKEEVDVYYCTNLGTEKTADERDLLDLLHENVLDRAPRNRSSDEDRIKDVFGLNNKKPIDPASRDKLPVDKDGKLNFNQMGMSDSKGTPKMADSGSGRPFRPETSSTSPQASTTQQGRQNNSSQTSADPSGAKNQTMPVGPNGSDGRSRNLSPAAPYNGGESDTKKNSFLPSNQDSGSFRSGDLDGQRDQMQNSIKKLQNEMQQLKDENQLSKAKEKQLQDELTKKQNELKNIQERQKQQELAKKTEEAEAAKIQEDARKKAISDKNTSPTRTDPWQNPAPSNGGRVSGGPSVVSPTGSGSGSGALIPMSQESSNGNTTPADSQGVSSEEEQTVLDESDYNKIKSDCKDEKCVVKSLEKFLTVSTSSILVEKENGEIIQISNPQFDKNGKLIGYSEKVLPPKKKVVTTEKADPSATKAKVLQTEGSDPVRQPSGEEADRYKAKKLKDELMKSLAL